MRLFPRQHFIAHRQTLTGLGLILAAFASTAQAGWDCKQGANGEWQCAGDGAAAVDNSALIIPAPIAPQAAGLAPAVTGNAEPTAQPGAAGEDDSAVKHSMTPQHLTQLGDDWVPLNQLSAKERKTLDEKAQTQAEICCGTYVDPVTHEKGEEPANAQLNAHADSTETDIGKQTTTLKGNVQVSQGYRYLRADSATLKKNPQQATLEGNVTLREPDLLLLSDKADVLVDENTAELSNVQYLMHEEHVHGTADSLSRSETGVISMINATYSYCPVGSEQWSVQSKTLTLDPNDSQGRARNATLRIKNIPVFYTPYLQFPLGDQRMSGFLTPTFGSGEDGADISAPYYFNLAPNYDLILTPRYISDRGEMLGSDFRHLSPYTKTAITANILPGDNKVAGNDPSDRWLLRARQDGGARQWNSVVDVNAVSDEHYFQDFSSHSLIGNNTTSLRKLAEFDYLPSDNWRTGVLTKNYQTLGNTVNQPHEILPSVFADGTYALDSGPVFKLHQAVTRFDHRDAGNLDTTPGVFYDVEQQEKMLIAGQRYNMDYSVELPMRSAGAFLTPKVGVRHVTQQLDETTAFTPKDNPSTTVGVASLDSGLIYERNSQWFGNSYRQTLEPRLFYYYAQQKNQDDIYNFDSNALSFSYAQLFRDYRLAGEDYIDDANQISAGISSRLLSPTTGRELVRVGIGQSYYLSKRDIVLAPDAPTTQYEQDRSRSSLVGEIAARLNQYWDIRTETLWNDDKAQRERQSLALRYRDDERRLFNVGYQFLDRPASANDLSVVTDRTVEQAYVSAVYPLNRQWSLIGHWNHDMTNSRDLETIAGFEYDSCCWSARVVARSWVVNRDFVDNLEAQETDNGIFLQFQLKSLGNFGDSLDKKLSDSIFGFEDRNKPLD